VTIGSPVKRHAEPSFLYVRLLRLLAAGKLTAEVEFLPDFLARLGIARVTVHAKQVALFAPFAILGGQFRIRFERKDLRLHIFQNMLLNRHDEAEGLSLFEPHDARTSELPVHGEGIWQPVGSHDSREGRNAVLRIVQRPGYQQAPAGIGAKDVARFESDDAARKIRFDNLREGEPNSSTQSMRMSEIDGPPFH